MNRRKWLWAVLLALPVAVGGAAGSLVYAKAQARPATYTCPITGEELPCEKCCPLNQKQQAKDESYVCPINGEELPCPDCCPLNKGK